MELKVLKDYQELSAAAASAIVACIKSNPEATLCFASGDTPKLCYRLLAESIRTERIDISKCFFIGLDEWMGIPPENTGSCHYFLHHFLFDPLGINPAQLHLFNAMSASGQEECNKMNALIVEKGGIDFMVVGVGMNGHIGFNEPGTSIHSNAHVAELDETTKTVGQKYFNKPVPVGKGITVGLKQVMESRTLLMMANGKKKAPVIKWTVEKEISTGFPATLMRQHLNGILMVDSEAASELKTEKK